MATGKTLTSVEMPAGPIMKMMTCRIARLDAAHCMSNSRIDESEWRAGKFHAIG